MHVLETPPGMALPGLPWACKPGLEAPCTAASSPSSASTQDGVLSSLPRLSRVLIVGNQRTKRALIGLEGVVKRATGLGGWHWLVGGP